MRIKENTPTIETKRLILRKFRYDDISSFFELMKDEEVNRFLPWFPLETFEGAKEFLEKSYLKYYEKPTAYRYAICTKELDRPIGYVNIGTKEPYDFGYGLRKEFWNNGMAGEAAKAVVGHISKAGFCYITATHDINNPASSRVMEKIGMTYRYSYVEQWLPKDILVTFRMYQLNFDGSTETYEGYREKYKNSFIEVL